MKSEWQELKDAIDKAKRVVFFGGAGVSTESGIPDFRSAHGLYAGAQGRSYEEMLSHDFYIRHTEAFWRFYRDVMLYPDAKPNEAHRALARLEKQGKLTAVVTQNIDGLHQAAGSRNVLELHGTVHRNRCVGCGSVYPLKEILTQEEIPMCPICGGALKPEVVLYGEALDDDVVSRSVNAIADCDLLIVGGTSLVVYPAAGLIRYRKRSCPLVLINRDATSYDDNAQMVIRDSIGEVLGAVVD